jgi:glycosyltransferase involved in cell wall biosynthesis
MGGVARVATDTARRWAAAGHAVTAIAPCHDGSPSEETHERGALTLLRVLPRGRVPQTFTDPRATRRWARSLGHEGFDVLVAHGCTTAGGLLAAGLRLPLVYVFHADAAKEARYLRSRLRPGIAWLSAAVLERRLHKLDDVALRRAANVIVLSEFSRRLLAERAPALGQRAVRVGGGVDTEWFTPAQREEARLRLGLDPATRLVFSVRRLEPRMGLENLLEGAALLADVEDLRIAVAGTGSLLARLRELRERLGLEQRVELLGRVSDDELPMWHRAADLFALPTVAYEGFGLVTAEALASGTPVIGTPVGATPELLEPLDRRLVARSSEPPALADAIRTGLRLGTPSFRARCREYAVARFAWSSVLPAWERALEDSARGRHDEEPAHAARLQLARNR